MSRSCINIMYDYWKGWKRSSILTRLFILSLIFQLLALELATAQLFPIQVNTQLTPPYTPYLTDYTASGADKMMVQVRVNDATVDEYLCKLRITIEGVGITIRTKPNVIFQPITIPGGGVPHILYGEDLVEYFHPDNLEFAGLSKREYEKTSKLPEGVYRFSVEVVDYNRNFTVSNRATTVAWIILNDPPLLNVPRKESKIQILDPTNIVFNWTPRHTGSPNAAFSTEYIFRMVEVWPVTRNPYDAFLSQPALYEVTTDRTQIVYGPAEPALIAGRKYAWQVQARDMDGRDLFKNQGRSEVFVFQFGDALGVPENLHLQNANASTLTVRWELSQAGASAVTYRVRYRPRKAAGQWYESTTSDPWKAISLLQPDTEYEVQVRAEQSPVIGGYTLSGFFKTLPQTTEEFVCTDNFEPPPAPLNTLPVFPLSVNDTIHAGGYDVLVREVTGSNGVYSGSGVAIIPWFNSAKVSVTFDKINVNDQFWLTSGVIKSVWNAQSKFVKKIETPLQPGAAPEVGGGIDVNVVATDSLIIIEDAAIVSVTKDADGNIVVETSDGNAQVLPKGNSYSVVDKLGNGYVIDEQGNIAKTTATEAIKASERGNRNYNIQFVFENAGVFGFDEKKYDALGQYYQSTEDGVTVPWKAVSTTEPDNLNAQLKGSGIETDKIKFEVNGSPLIPQSATGGNYTLSVQGRAQGMQEELLALYTKEQNEQDEVLGKVNLVAYDEVINNLVIVPVNNVTLPVGATINDIAVNLTAIYGQAVGDWRVSQAGKITVEGLAEKFNDGETGALTNYTDDMKKVINAFGGRFQDKTYYLFLVANPISGQTLGYMPRSKQAGFIFVDAHRSDIPKLYRTIAHELGHGAFNLKHTFSEVPGLAKGSTDNLMDYPNGNKLYKYQWDQIHEPQRVIGLFEADEDAQSVIVTNMTQFKDAGFGNPDGSFTFISPTGIPFTLPPSTQRVEFWTNDIYSDGVLKLDEAPDGALVSFTIENQRYSYYKIVNSKEGSGYKLQRGGDPYVDIISKTLKNVDKAIIGLPCLEEGRLKFIAQQLPFKGELQKVNYDARGEVVSSLPIESIYNPSYSSAKIPLDATLDFEYTQEAKDFIDANKACLSELARWVIKGADVIQRNPGFYTLYKECTTKSLKYPELNGSSYVDPRALARYFNELKDFPEIFRKYVDDTKYANENLLLITDINALNSLLKNTCEENYKLFTATERKHIINTLSKGTLQDSWLGMGNNRENIVIYTLRQAPPDQYKVILDELKVSHYKLLKTLITKCDNQLIGQDNFDKLIDAITIMVQNVYFYNKLTAEHDRNRILRWGNDGFLSAFHYTTPVWTGESDDYIKFKYEYISGSLTGTGEYTGRYIDYSVTSYAPIEVEPFDFVTLRLYSDARVHGGEPILKKSVAEYQAVPALYLYWMINRKATHETLETIKAGVNLALFAIGAGEIAAARTGVRLAFAIADQAFFATSFVLDAGVRAKLEAGPNGENWKSVFKVFDAFNITYGAFRLGQGITLATRDILAKRALLRQLKQNENWNSLTPAEQNLIKDQLAKAEQGMEEMQKLIDEAEQSAKLMDEVVDGFEGVASSFGKLPANIKSSLDNSPFASLSSKLDNEPHVWLGESGIPTVQTPKGFLNEVGNHMYDLVIDGKFYVKYDLSDGRILLGDLSGNYYAFAQEISRPVINAAENADEIIKAHITAKANKLITLAGLGGTKVLNILGESVTLSTSKVNTMLGRFRPDIQTLFNELGSFKNLDLGEVPGGINLLNRPQAYESMGNWWTGHNQPWLKRAVDRGDDIYLATLPKAQAEILDVVTKRLKGAYAEELNYIASRQYKPKNVSEAQWWNIVTWLRPVDFAALDIPRAINHIKFRDFSVPRRRGIGGCHDASEWAKLRQVGEVGAVIPIGKTLDEVPEVIISEINPHPSVPGVQVVKYKIPAVDGKLTVKVNNENVAIGYTTGQLSVPNQGGIKTIYDPAIWTDIKLEQALKEAVQDASNKAGGVIPAEFRGTTAEGYVIHGYYRDGKIDSFFFE